MPAEPRGLAAQAVFIKKGGRGEMTKAPISLQDLRRRLYVKAKTESTWRFWGLYVVSSLAALLPHGSSEDGDGIAQ